MNIPDNRIFPSLLIERQREGLELLKESKRTAKAGRLSTIGHVGKAAALKQTREDCAGIAEKFETDRNN